MDQAGEYEIELRRWPKESGKRLTDGWPERSDLGNAVRPIAGAGLQVAGKSRTIDTRPDDTHARFRVRLPTGRDRNWKLRFTMQTEMLSAVPSMSM